MLSAPKPAIDCRCLCGADGAFGYWCDGALQWFCAQHRQRRWSADACRSRADANHARDALLGGPDDAPPNLQMLVAEHGGYDKITREAWAQYDEATGMWQAQRREKYRRR